MLNCSSYKTLFFYHYNFLNRLINNLYMLIKTHLFKDKTMKKIIYGFNLMALIFTLAFSSAVSAQTVNINTADAQTIADSLKGIGLSKAQAIVAWRETNGKFTDLETLQEVKGIGAKTLEKNKEDILF